MAQQGTPQEGAEFVATTISRQPTNLLGRSALANLSVAALYEKAIERAEGMIAASGPLVVRTGQHTGRSPKDKYIVDEPDSHDGVWWGGFNQPISEERYDALRQRMVDHINSREVFVQDCFVGADKRYRRSVRAYTETAWASIFSDNLFIRPTAAELVGFEPNFTIIDAPTFRADPERDGVRSETVVLVHLARQEILIGGTQYAGEMKKGAFGIMNYRLPPEGVLPMHSSVNVGRNGDVAVFFGLSGTGKTTLSADPERILIGDDEHGWSDEGVFNFEGGCYAKTIRLSHIYEPDIYSTTRRFGTILENVVIDPLTRELDLDSEQFTENTAAPSRSTSSRTRRIVASPATLDDRLPDRRCVRRAATDLPPDARPGDVPLHLGLHSQAGRHGGGHQGADRDVLDLLRCAVHAAPSERLRRMLGERLDRHNVPVWMVNTGWSGGPTAPASG